PDDDPRLPPLPGEPRDPSLNDLTAAWSPAGNLLALLSVNAYQGGLATGGEPQFLNWIALIRPDGSGFTTLPAARPGLPPYKLAFSWEGAFLAVGVYDGVGLWWTVIYSPDGSLVRALPGYELGPWSPTGHTLALIGQEGVSLLSLPQATPQRIGPAGCSGIA